MTLTRKPSARPFRLSDALVLVLATALGFAAIKFVDKFMSGNLLDVWTPKLFGDVTWDDKFDAWAILLWTILDLVNLFVLPWVMALLVLRIRRPRPRLRLVWRQPGAVACLLLLLPLAHRVCTLSVEAATGRWSGIPWTEINFDFSIPGQGAIMVLAAWVVLAIGKIGRPERSWIDRTGRATGGLMIAIFLIVPLALASLRATIPKYNPISVPPLPSGPSLPTLPPDLDLFPDLPPEAQEAVSLPNVPPTAVDAPAAPDRAPSLPPVPK